MKPKGWYTGIVNLNDLPSENIYINLKEPFKTQFLKTAKSVSKTWSNLARQTGLNLNKYYSVNKIQHFKRGSCINLSDILKISEFLKQKGHKQFSVNKIGKNIKKMSSGRGNNYILSPKFPLNFNTNNGAILIASIFGDGYFAERKTGYSELGYSNTRIELRKKVSNSFKFCIGKCRLNIKNRLIRFPTVSAYILEALGLEKGRKTETNLSIPEFILNGNNIIIGAFLQQMFDDESNVNVQGRAIRLVSGTKINKPPNLLLDIKQLLQNLDIEVSSPKYCRYKKPSYFWGINIYGKTNFKMFKEKIGFHLKYKQKNLSQIVNGTHRYKSTRRETILNNQSNPSNKYRFEENLKWK